jgi:hypothetical protein
MSVRIQIQTAFKYPIPAIHVQNESPFPPVSGLEHFAAAQPSRVRAAAVTVRPSSVLAGLMRGRVRVLSPVP